MLVKLVGRGEGSTQGEDFKRVRRIDKVRKAGWLVGWLAGVSCRVRKQGCE